MASEAGGDGGVDAIREEFGDGAETVLERLADLNVDETPPVELMATVQEWKDRLED